MPLLTGNQIYAVDLISVTPQAEQMILHCARVSSPHPDSKETGLIGFLIRNNHWSPFEMANMCVQIITSRTIAHQILRHRSFSFQEFSQRYAEAPGFITHKARMQAEKNRQSSTDDAPEDIADWFENAQMQVRQLAERKYSEAREKGIAKEVARFLLPEATETKLFMNGTVRSWVHYLALRDDEHAQLEHQEIARAIKRIFNKQFPVISQAVWPAEYPRVEEAQSGQSTYTKQFPVKS